MEYEVFEHDLFTNQICVQTDKPKLPKDIWASYNIEDMYEAMRTLSKGGFELYMYLISNIDGYKFGLGPTPVGNATEDICPAGWRLPSGYGVDGNIILSKDRSRAGMTAPAEGLYLNKVNY